MAAVAAAAMVVAVAAAAATRGLEVAAASDLEVAAMAGLSSVDAEVALGSEAAEGSEVAGAAAAGSVTTGSMTTGSMTTTDSVVGEPAADPGERAARAKSHDLTVALICVRRGGKTTAMKFVSDRPFADPDVAARKPSRSQA